MSRIAILKTARLGDIWFTTPLAGNLHEQGHSVTVVYDAQYGNPLAFFPHIEASPVRTRVWLRSRNRWAYALNQGLNQVLLLNRIRRQNDRVIWREIFPWRRASRCATTSTRATSPPSCTNSCRLRAAARFAIWAVARKTPAPFSRHSRWRKPAPGRSRSMPMWTKTAAESTSVASMMPRQRGDATEMQIL